MIICILIYKYSSVNLFQNSKTHSSFWNNMPVMHFDKEYQTNHTIINPKYGYSIPDLLNIVVFDIQKDLADITIFLNNNYIDGYHLYEDYIFQKMSIQGSVGIICKIDNKIVGFIQSSPYHFLNKIFSYVDLLCVSKEYRKQGLAKKMIDNINYMFYLTLDFF